jgi:GNAT superfamily N-acetyltransferase
MKSGFTAVDITLRDGRAVHIRAMRPADEAEILQAFDRLSQDARYMRFMRTVRDVNVERLRKTLASFPVCGLGIVATVPATDGIDVVGSAIFVIGSDPATCEFAITVAAEYGGAGLGRVLLTALITAAKQRGLKEMEGFVLAANKPMLGLAARVGFSVSIDPDDRAIRLCRLRL